MPINAKPEYFVAEAKFHEAETTAEKIVALKNMLAVAPTHKGAERLRSEIKKKIARLREVAKKEKKTGKGKTYSISKEGAAQVVFIGPPNSGKSTLLAKLSDKDVKISAYKFTTKNPEVRMIPYENVWIQGIEIPAVYEGFHNTKLGRRMFALVRNADFVIMVIRSKKDRLMVEEELKMAGIELKAKIRYHENLIDHIPSMVISWKSFDDTDLIEKIWKKQKKIRVQTKTGHKIAKKPIVLRVGATVEDAARKIHKDFVEKFRYAKIYGPSAKFAGQQVGLEHKLKDKDVIEVFTS